MSDQAEDTGVLDQAEQVQELGAQVAQLTQERDEARAEVASLTEQVNVWGTDADRLGEMVTSLEVERDEAREQARLAAAEVDTLRAEVAQASALADSRLDELDAARATLAEERRSSQEIQQHLRQQLSTAVNNAAERETEFEARGTELVHVREQAEPLQAEVKTLRRTLAQRDETILELQDRLKGTAPKDNTVQVGWVGVDGSLRKVSDDPKDVEQAEKANERAVFAINTSPSS
jgi:chromosome segregation ATPase